MSGHQVSKNCSGVVACPGVRCSKSAQASYVRASGVQTVFGRHMSGRQVSKMKLDVKCLSDVSLGVRCLSNSWASGVQKWVRHQVSIKPLGFSCPKSGFGVKSQCVRSP